jgi:hypothetical protein
VQTCRRELLDRALIWNQRHLLHALRESGPVGPAGRPGQVETFGPVRRGGQQLTLVVSQAGRPAQRVRRMDHASEYSHKLVSAEEEAAVRGAVRHHASFPPYLDEFLGQEEKKTRCT